jgi:hypothetical protein
VTTPTIDPLTLAEDLPDDELARLAMEADAASLRARMVRDRLTFEVIRRARDRNPAARQWLAGGIVVELDPRFGPYQWDPEALASLLAPHLAPGQLEECIEAIEVPAHTDYVIHATSVKKYARKAGIPDEELAGVYRRDELPPRVTYQDLRDDG